MNDQATRLRQIYSSSTAATHDSGGQQLPIKTIAITSGKGGVGKSALCLNIAIALAKHNRKVLVVDADLNLGNLDVMLGMNPEHTLRNVIAGQISLRNILLQGPSGIHLAPSTSGAQELIDVKPGDRRRVIEAIRQLTPSYDFVLFDTPAGLGSQMYDFIESADSVFVVTTPEPTAIIDAYAVVKMLWSRKLKKRLQLLVNYSESKIEAEEVYQKLNLVTQHYMQQSLDDFHFVLYDEMVSKSIFDQQPMFEEHPKTPASVCIDEIAEAIIKQSKVNHRIRALKNWIGGAAEISRVG
ncbi:MinD/ParA family protein [candidate division KSB1 bacterium]|nr:MinD/ParA family protein [candidate division KSB1 bacterium]